MTDPADAALGPADAEAADLPLFRQQLLHHLQLQVALCDQLLQAGVLPFQWPQPYGVCDLQPTIFMTPALKGVFRNPILAAQLADLYPRGFRLPQYLNDLLFRKPWLGHLAISSLQPTRCLTFYLVRNLGCRSKGVRFTSRQRIPRITWTQSL